MGRGARAGKRANRRPAQSPHPPHVAGGARKRMFEAHQLIVMKILLHPLLELCDTCGDLVPTFHTLRRLSHVHLW